jgi:MFS family permease
MADRFGRRHLLLIAAETFALGAIISSLARGTPMLIAGRLIVGVAIGLASFTVPLYISEMAPEQDRGWMVSLNQLAVTIGILLAYVVDFAFAGSGQWRWMLGLAVVPALLLGSGLAFLPESPRWFASKGKNEQAQQALVKIRGTPDVQAEYQEIQTSLADEKGGGWADVFSAAARRYGWRSW